MNSIGITPSNFLRVLATFRVLMGIATLAFVAVLVFEFREQSFIWGAVGGVILLSVKGLFGLIIGFRFLRRHASARIRSSEWRMLGIGYCIVALVFLMAAFSGEGWVYGVVAAFVATIAPLWFVLAWRAESDVIRQTHSNSTTAGDAL